MAVVASKDTKELIAAIEELAECRSEPVTATAFNVGNSFFAQNEVWRQKDPKTSAEIMQFYRQSVPGVAQQVFATYGIPHEVALREKIVELARPEVGLNMLDFGAGIGSMVLAMLATGCRCTHVDVGGEQAEYAAWRYRKHGYTVAAKGERLKDVEMVALRDDYMTVGISELRDRTFDLVVCTEVIEHVPDPEAFVALLSGFVRPGGTLVATTSFSDCEGMVPMHLNIDKYTDEGFVAVFEKHGLRRIEDSIYKKVE